MGQNLYRRVYNAHCVFRSLEPRLRSLANKSFSLRDLKNAEAEELETFCSEFSDFITKLDECSEDLLNIAEGLLSDMSKLKQREDTPLVKAIKELAESKDAN